MSIRARLSPGGGILLTSSVLVGFSLGAPNGLIRAIAARLGADSLLWCGVLFTCLSLIWSWGSATTGQARRRRDGLRRDEDLAQAMAVSYYDQESLDGALALSAMGQRVEGERQALLARSGRLALVAGALVAIAAGAAVLGFEEPKMAVNAVRTMAAACASAAILLVFAQRVRAISGSLEPTADQIRAAVIRHHERQEAEMREQGGGIAALAAVLAGRPAPSEPVRPQTPSRGSTEPAKAR